MAWFIGMACYTATIFISVFGTAGFAASTHSSETLSGPADVFWPFMIIIPFLVFALVILVGIASVIYGVVAAIQALRGKAFRYVIIGDCVERFLQQGKQTQGQPVGFIP
jgi:uncharacterized membrane protein